MITPDSAEPRLGRDARIHGVSFNPTTRAHRVFGLEDFNRELDDPDVFSWIDVEAPDISSLNEVLKCVDIDLVLVGHFDRPEVLPRIVEHSDCLAFYLYEVLNPDQHLDTSHELTEISFARMIVVLGVDYIITYHRRPIEAVEYVKATCAENFALAGETPNFVAFLLLNRCLYDYAHLNLANDNYLDLLEETVFVGDDERRAENIGIASSNILTLKRLTTSLHIVLMVATTKRSKFVSDAARSSYNEMLQNAIAIRASIDSSRDMLDGVVSSIQAAAANRMSDIARVLTVVSAIILPLTLISGIYGMNFENMPELKTERGYFIVLGVMVTIALVLLAVFWKLGWLGKEDGPGEQRRK
jgi:magnesium transporter